MDFRRFLRDRALGSGGPRAVRTGNPGHFYVPLVLAGFTRTVHGSSWMNFKRFLRDRELGSECPRAVRAGNPGHPCDHAAPVPQSKS